MQNTKDAFNGQSITEKLLQAMDAIIEAGGDPCADSEVRELQRQVNFEGAATQTLSM